MRFVGRACDRCTGRANRTVLRPRLEGDSAMRRRGLKAMVGGAAAAAFVVVPGLAGAAKSYQGDDYSYDFNSYHQIASCDMESDNHGVHSDAKLSNGQTIGRASVDSDGANNGSCGSSANLGIIIQHRTCEEINFWPDNCGSWVGTGA